MWLTVCMYVSVCVVRKRARESEKKNGPFMLFSKPYRKIPKGSKKGGVGMLWNNVCPTKLNKFLIWAKRRSFWTFKFHLKKAAKWKLEMTDKDICSRKHKRLFSLLIKTFSTLGRQSVWTVPVFFCSYNDPALEFPVDLPIKLAVRLTERHWGATSNSFPPEKKSKVRGCNIWIAVAAHWLSFHLLN